MHTKGDCLLMSITREQAIKEARAKARSYMENYGS
jgi:hypothetical protein